MFPSTSLRPRCFAVTGGIACGKSLFAENLKRLGAAILDTDVVAHQLEASGGGAVSALAAAFGPGVVQSDGSVDRVALGNIVFGHPEELGRLNAILHPLIQAKVTAWCTRPGSPETIRLVLAPILFECGWERLQVWNGIICIAASAEVQIARLMQRRGLTEKEARLRLASQLSVAEKAARSDYVIWNDATPEALAREAQALWRKLNQPGLSRSGD